MDERLVGVLVTLGLFILSICVLVIYQRAKRKDIRTVEAEQNLERLIAMGLRTPEGGPVCIVCRIRATEYAPITGVSWMDKLPLLNRLYSLAPRHVIVDNIEGDFCFCRLHKQMAVSQLEKAHAQLRADRAKFNAEQETRIASLDGGELLQHIIKMHRDHMRSLKLDMSTPLPALSQSKEDDDSIMTAVVTAPSMMPEEDT